MKTTMSARKLVRFIEGLDDFEVYRVAGPVCSHMGAILTDVVLQPGMNYQTVVAPRVQRILKEYEASPTVSEFARIVRKHGAASVLRWRHHEKPARLEALTTFLAHSGLETQAEIRGWLLQRPNRTRLMTVRGMGRKSIDYMCGLVGCDTVAVDRHIINFLSDAGIRTKDYEFVWETVSYAADLLGIERRSLDHSIWRRMSGQRMLPLF